jgi:hypothetical protein
LHDPKPANYPHSTTICGSPFPTSLKDLNELRRNVSVISNIKNIDLTLFGVSGKLGKRDILVVSDFIKYKVYSCDGKKRRIAVGMRLFLHVSDMTSKISVTNLAQLSAAVELNKAKANYEVYIFGLDDNGMYKNLPSSSFNVDAYSKITSSFDNLFMGLSGDTRIDPIELPDYVQ